MEIQESAKFAANLYMSEQGLKVIVVSEGWGEMGVGDVQVLCYLAYGMPLLSKIHLMHIRVHITSEEIQ